MWQFAEAVAGIGEACRALDIPITGGNVSLYNETDGTRDPADAGARRRRRHRGRVEACSRRTFKRAGTPVVLLGDDPRRARRQRVPARRARADSRRAAAARPRGRAAAAAAAGRRRRGRPALSAHDCAEGGLAVALAECCFDTGGIGVEVDVPVAARPIMDASARSARSSASRPRASSCRRREPGGRSWTCSAAASPRPHGVPARELDRHDGRRHRRRDRASPSARRRIDDRRGRRASRIWATAHLSATVATPRLEPTRRGCSLAQPGPKRPDARQVPRRVRRLRHLRPRRGGEPRLPRASTRCSTAGRRAPASPRPTGTASRVTKEMGHVADVFNAPSAGAGCPGTLAIGHVRYSTAGDSRLANAQPFLIDCAHGQIAIAHNGNLVNAQELRDELERAGLDLPDHERHRGHPAPATRARGRPASRTRHRVASRRCAARSRWSC